MAQVHKIATWGGTVLYNFLTGDLQLEYQDGWQLSEGDGGSVVETYRLVGMTDDSSIINAVNDLSDIAERVRNFGSNDKNKDAIYLYVGANGETAKRALIVDMSDTVPSPDYIQSPLLGKSLGCYVVAITRGPWEATGTAIGLNQVGVGLEGDKYTLPAIAGSLPAANYDFFIQGESSANPITDFWAGVLPNDASADANATFIGRWEAEKGTLGTDASLVADANASGAGSNTVKVSFATASGMTKRVEIKLDDIKTVGTLAQDFLGEFLILACLRVDSGVTCNVQLKFGFTGDASVDEADIYYTITNTSYLHFPLGIVGIPPFPTRNTNVDFLTTGLFNFGLQVWAERTAGTGTDGLYIDYLVLIPNKSKIIIHGANIDYTDVDNYSGVKVYRNEDGQNVVNGVNRVSGVSGFDLFLNPEVDNWSYPVQGGLLIVAGQGATARVTTDTVSILWNIIKRFRTHGDNSAT